MNSPYHSSIHTKACLCPRIIISSIACQTGGENKTYMYVYNNISIFGENEWLTTCVLGFVDENGSTMYMYSPCAPQIPLCPVAPTPQRTLSLPCMNT